MVTRLQNLTKLPQLLTMPPEILIHILGYLEWYQLVSVQRVSRTFRDLVRNSIELRYMIELGADALVHNDPQDESTPLTIQDRLNLLLDRRRRWRMLDWTNQMTIPLPGSCQAYELVGGVFAKSMRGGFEDMWPPASRHFIAAKLPTRDNPHVDTGEASEAKDTVKEDLGIWTRDFAIDPTQDLLALLEVDLSGYIKVHIRTLSSQEIHPLATQSPLIAEPPPHILEIQISNCFLQIVGDIVAMFYWQSGHHLRIWNWHTGVMMTSQSEADLPLGCWDVTFLSPRAYMIVCTGQPGSLDLYTVNEVSASDGAVQAPTHVIRLRLPELQSHRHLRTITTHSSPYLAHPAALHSPFVQPQDLRIHLVQLLYGDLLPGYALYVKNEYLLDLMDQVREQRGIYRDLDATIVGPSLLAHFSSSGAPEMSLIGRFACKYLPWEDWGPGNTRLLQQDLRFQWLRYVNGYRVVMPPSASGVHSIQEVQRHTELCVCDFNVHPKRIDDPCDALTHTVDCQEDGESGGREWTYELKTEETEIHNDDLFLQPVKSSLAYSVARLTGVSGYTGFMIDEQRLVGMKENMSLGLAACDVDVFTL